MPTPSVLVEWYIAWLWQGSLLVLLVSGALRLVPRASAATKYLVWWASLVALCALPVVSWPGRPAAIAADVIAVRVPLPATATVAALPTEWLTLPAVAGWLVALGIAAWVAIAGVRLTGLARAIVALGAMKHRCRPFPESRERNLSGWMSVRARGRRARLCLNPQVPVCSVLGLTTPIIAVPPALAEALTDTELDQIVLHEQAHVRRWDDWSRLLQVIATTLSGAHPGVWWISRHLHLEREIACDDWVLSQSATPRAYASCLAKVAEVTMWHRARGLAPSALRSPREMSRRVAQILRGDRTIARRGSRVALGGWVVLLSATIAVLAGLPPVIVVDRTGSTPSAAPPAPTVISPLPGQAIALTTAVPAPLVSRRPRPRLAAAEVVRLTSPVAFDWAPRATAMPVAATPEPDRLAVSAAIWPADRWRGGREAPNLDAAILVSDPAGAAESDSSRWKTVARAGMAVGSGFAKAGISTAKAFSGLGATLSRPFRRDN